MTDDLNDDLSDLLAAASTGPALAPIYRAPDKFVPAVERFTEGCPKCRGSGKFISYSGRVLGDCFACKGQGGKTFKTSPEARAKARTSSAERKGRELAAYVEEYRVELAWLAQASESNLRRGGTFGFPQSMLDAVAKYGSLTDNQLAAVRKCMARDAERAAQREVAKAARVEAAPVVASEGIDRLKAAFDKATARAAEKGLSMRSPKITIGEMTIKPARATSANPGALYVTEGETYLGKIAGGRFLATRECSPEQSTQVQAFVADPAEAAKVYGQETGTCCLCNATLISKWRLKGVGPICAAKFGFV